MSERDRMHRQLPYCFWPAGRLNPHSLRTYHHRDVLELLRRWKPGLLAMSFSFLSVTIYIVTDYNTSRGRKTMSCVCTPFWIFHDGVIFERIELEGKNLLRSTPNVKLLLGRNRYDCQIIILAKIANLTLFYFITLMNFHDGITFKRIKLKGWNILFLFSLSVHYWI